MEELNVAEGESLFLADNSPGKVTEEKYSLALKITKSV